MIMCLDCGEVMEQGKTVEHECPVKALANELDQRKRAVSGLLSTGVANTRRVVDVERQLAESNRKLLTLMRVTAAKLTQGLMTSKNRRLP